MECLITFLQHYMFWSTARHLCVALCKQLLPGLRRQTTDPDFSCQGLAQLLAAWRLIVLSCSAFRLITDTTRTMLINPHGEVLMVFNIYIYMILPRYVIFWLCSVWFVYSSLLPGFVLFGFGLIVICLTNCLFFDHKCSLTFWILCAFFIYINKMLSLHMQHASFPSL